MTATIRTVLCVIALIVAVMPVPAAEFNMDVKADGIQLGKPVCGPELSKSDLEGHVVLVEFWGINCAPCLASLPKLAKLSQELGPAGLVVVGAHAQGGTPEEIRAKAEAAGVGFAVVESANVSGGHDFSGIPHCMLFDHTGKCLYRGTPGAEVEKMIREAVGTALVASTGKEKFVKLTSIVDGLKKGQSPLPLLHKAALQTRSSDPTTAEEAKLLTDKLNELGQRQLDQVAKLKESDPAAAYTKLQRMSSDFRGTTPGKHATEQLTAMRRDRKMMAEIDARRTLEAVRKIDKLLQDAPGHDDPKSVTFQKTYASALKQLQSSLRQMKRSWPEAKATQEALAVGEKYGVTVR
jgi:thiol-disulfide isomerase/thioredoxin